MIGAGWSTARASTGGGAIGVGGIAGRAIFLATFLICGGAGIGFEATAGVAGSGAASAGGVSRAMRYPATPIASAATRIAPHRKPRMTSSCTGPSINETIVASGAGLHKPWTGILPDRVLKRKP